MIQSELRILWASKPVGVRVPLSALRKKSSAQAGLFCV